MKWLSVHVGGQQWGVYLVKGGSKLLGGDRECDGITYLDKCRIYLSRDLERPALDDTLLHELLHAAFAVSGAGHVLKEAVGDSEKTAIAEEQIVRCLTPIWHRMLLDLGFKFPKGPTHDS